MSTSSYETPSGPPHRRLPLGLISAAIVALIFMVGYFLLPASVHFRVFHDEASFNRFMSSRVRPACTMAEIQQSLGDGKVLTEKDRQWLLAVTKDFCRQTPESYPDGMNANDQFVGYDLGGYITYLQFRDGVLVNFNPREYDGHFQFAAIRP